MPTDDRQATELSRPAWASAPPTRIRLLVVDDHPAVRRTLRGLLEDQADFEVVAVVDGARAALSLAREVEIDVAVVDYELGTRHNGRWLCRELKRLRSPPMVLIYSAYCDGLLAAASVVVQADGVLSKASLGWQLCHAIRGITSNRLPLPIAPLQLEETIRRRLDEEEQIIFAMLLNGTSLDEMAEVLNYAHERLRSRLSRMLSKLEDIALPSTQAPSGRVHDGRISRRTGSLQTRARRGPRGPPLEAPCVIGLRSRASLRRDP